jgi:CRISPR-associated protein Cmr2
MAHVFGIFQIGPVQEFITCAKKTQDFWSGSYLISYLTCVAIHAVVKACPTDGKNAIIYPDLTNQPLYDYVAKLEQDGKQPWDQPPSGDQLRPTVPNRFVAKLDVGNAKTVLDNAAREVTEAFSNSKIAGRVKDELWRKINGSSSAWDINTWNAIWTRQKTKEVFEVYWTISPLDDAQYSTSYREAEALFGARKAVRNFSQPDPEPGYKCTLCGQREPLNVTPKGSEKRRDLRDFWNEVRKRTGHRFRDGEHLCAVCTTKRLAPEWVFGRGRDLPSTSSMAVADFLSGLVEAYQKNPSAFSANGSDRVQDFATAARAVAKASGQNAEIEPLPRVMIHQ